MFLRISAKILDSVIKCENIFSTMILYGVSAVNFAFMKFAMFLQRLDLVYKVVCKNIRIPEKLDDFINMLIFG